MSAALEAKAEILMLARLLGGEPEQFAYLEGLPPEDLRTVRDGATELLFEGDRAMMGRLAAGSKLLPAGALATIAQNGFGALLCARIVGFIEPGKAAEVAGKLTPEFLAEVSVEMDPRKASAVISRIPPDLAAKVAKILTEQDEFVTMGRFVGHLSDDAITACLEVIPDGKLLPIAFVMEEKGRLDHVMAMLDDERAASVARDAAASDHWAEALDLAEHVSPEQAARLGDVIAGLDDEVLTSLVEAATESDLWEDLLPLSRSMSLAARERFAAVEAMHRPEVLDEMTRVTITHGLWPELLPMVPVLPDGAQLALASIAGRHQGAVEGAVQAAVEHALWADLVALVPLLDPEGQAVVAREIASLDAARQRELIAAAGEQELWVPLVRIGADLDPATREAIAGLVAEAETEILAELLAAIDAADVWDEMVRFAESLPQEHLDRLLEQAKAMDLLDRLGALADR